MKTSFFLSLFILTTMTTTLHSAVLLEPSESKPDTYKARHLYFDPSPARFDPAKDEKISIIKKPAAPAVLETIKPVTTQAKPSPSVKTTLKAYYEKVTIESVNQIASKYKSIPGGITLEGSGKKLDFIQEADFDPAKNVFILNQKIEYANPLSQHEMKQIMIALQKSDLLGVSLGEKDIIYGALQQGNLPSIHLKLADHFLGSIVFAQPRWIALHSFPNGYKPQNHTSSGGLYAVYFNFHNYHFTLKNDQLSLDHAALVARLVPLTNHQTADGGYLPDIAKIEKGLLPQEYERNIQHIVENISHYEKETRLNKAHRYGEAAAFARALKDSRISLEKLVNKM